MSEKEKTIIDYLKKCKENKDKVILLLQQSNEILLNYIDKLNNQLQQKENIIKEVREDLDNQITFCTNEANGTTNDKYCRIAINYLKHLKDKLDKGE